MRQSPVWIISKGVQVWTALKCLHSRVHYNVVYDTHGLETAYMSSTDEWIKKCGIYAERNIIVHLSK